VKGDLAVTEEATTTPSIAASDHDHLAVLLAQMGAVVFTLETVDTTVELVTSLATEAIPGAVGAGVSMVNDRGTRSVAFSNPLVKQADALQYEVDAGPCLTSCRQRVTVRVDDVTVEDRWPEWTTAVADIGIRSTLSVPLVAADVCVGSIKVYSTQPAAFDDHAERLLELFARQAAILLVNTQTLADARRSNRQLTDALNNRDLIGQAKGIFLAGGAVDDAAAFAMLVAASHRANTKVHTVAQRLIDSVTSRNTRRSPR
jgi:GAF domain-containing protein